MVPLLLHHLGTSAYGLYAALTSVVGYFGLLTFGSALTVPRYVADHAARGEDASLSTFVSTYLAAHLAVAAIGVIAAFGLAPVVARWLDVPADLKPLVAPAFRLVVAGWALGLTAGLWQSLFTGLGEVHVANLANSARTLLTLAAAALVVLLKGGLEALLVAFAVAGLSGSVTLWWLIRRRHPEIPLSLGRARLTTLRATGVPASYFFLMQISALVVMSTDNIVISVFIGVGQVAPYAVAFQMWAVSLAVLWSGVDVLMPFFTRWHAAGDRTTLQHSYLRATRAVFAGSVLAAIVVAAFGASLIRWWVGPDLAVDRRVLWVFSLMFLTATPIHTASLLLAAIGRHKAPALGGALEAVLNLTISLLLVRPLGILGVAIGTLLSGALANAWIAPGAACREMGIPVQSYARAALLPSLLPALTGGGAALVLSHLVATGTMQPLFAVVGTAGAFALTAWNLSFDDDDRERALLLVRRSPATVLPPPA